MSSFLKFLFRIYQWIISPFVHVICGPGCGCRFEPTCSNYAIQALDLHGASRGSWLAVKRIFRCHPWGGFGFDPVPPKDSRVSNFDSRLNFSSDPLATMSVGGTSPHSKIENPEQGFQPRAGLPTRPTSSPKTKF